MTKIAQVYIIVAQFFCVIFWVPTACHLNRAVAFEVAVDVVFANYFFDLGKVLATKLFENRNLVGNLSWALAMP